MSHVSRGGLRLPPSAIIKSRQGQRYINALAKVLANPSVKNILASASAGRMKLSSQSAESLSDVFQNPNSKKWAEDCWQYMVQLAIVEKEKYPDIPEQKRVDVTICHLVKHPLILKGVKNFLEFDKRPFPLYRAICGRAEELVKAGNYVPEADILKMFEETTVLLRNGTTTSSSHDGDQKGAAPCKEPEKPKVILVERICAHGDHKFSLDSNAPTSKCGRCMAQVYCCKEHQRAHWPQHKLVCAVKK